MEIENIKEKHKTTFGTYPELIVKAPGRVNLIGEHTDYSEGFVMPVAINLGIWASISKNNKDILDVNAIDLNQRESVEYSKLGKNSKEWFNYPVGVVSVLKNKGFSFGGVDISFSGNIPQGAGLSSSAALEIAVGYAIQMLFGLDIEGTEMAKICQQAEHDVVGVQCGIMDQYISRMGELDHALLIDTRSLEYRLIPLDLGDAKIIITNSNVPHKLSSSQYNQRVSECKEAVKVLNEIKSGTFLRDYNINDYYKAEKLLSAKSETIRKRAFHVISENERVLNAEIALKNGDLKEFGKLMNQSHESLKSNFEVSSKELDWLAEKAQSVSGCYGSRMTGAGFGGCTVTIIEKDSIPAYIELLKEYKSIFNYSTDVYETTGKNGVRVL